MVNNQKKRVLNVNVYNFGVGGLSTIVYQWGMHIDSNKYVFDYCGWKKVVESSYTKNISQKGGKIFTYNCRNRLSCKIKRCKFLKKIIKQNHYEIVHIHADRAQNSVLYALTAKLVGVKKIIIHSHSNGIDCNERGLRLVYHKITKSFLPYVATDFLACSIDAAQWMYPYRILKDKRYEIISNGIDIKSFAYDKNKRNVIRAELEWPDKLILGHVGRFTYQKNHEFLIDVFNEVYKENKNARLLLIGQGELKEKIFAKINRLNLLHVVKHIPCTQNVNDYMQAMDVFLFPSRFEGLGIVAIEAQAAGLPTLLSDKVPPEANLCDLVQICSITDGAILWKELIQSKINLKQKRTDFAEMVMKKGFSIDDSVQQLEKIYNI